MPRWPGKWPRSSRSCRHGRGTDGMRLTLYICLALVILAGLLPVAWLLAQSLPGTGGTGPPAWTLLFGNGAQAGLWRNTLLLAALSACLATLLGAPLGVI